MASKKPERYFDNFNDISKQGILKQKGNKSKKRTISDAPSQSTQCIIYPKKIPSSNPNNNSNNNNKSNNRSNNILFNYVGIKEKKKKNKDKYIKPYKSTSPSQVSRNLSNFLNRELNKNG